MQAYNTTYDPVTKTWFGRQLPRAFPSNVNLAQVIFEKLNSHPDRIGQISDDDGQRMTNGEILLNSIRVAQHLQQLGIQSGDVVGIIARNHANVVAVMFGAVAIAAPTNALDPSFKTR